MYGAAATFVIALVRGVRESERYRKGKKISRMLDALQTKLTDETVSEFLDDIERMRIPKHDEIWSMLYEAYRLIHSDSNEIHTSIRIRCTTIFKQKGAKWAAS